MGIHLNTNSNSDLFPFSEVKLCMNLYLHKNLLLRPTSFGSPYKTFQRHSLIDTGSVVLRRALSFSPSKKFWIRHWFYQPLHTAHKRCKFQRWCWCMTLVKSSWKTGDVNFSAQLFRKSMFLQWKGTFMRFNETFSLKSIWIPLIRCLTLFIIKSY